MYIIYFQIFQNIVLLRLRALKYFSSFFNLSEDICTALGLNNDHKRCEDLMSLTNQFYLFIKTGPTVENKCSFFKMYLIVLGNMTAFLLKVSYNILMFSAISLNWLSFY